MDTRSDVEDASPGRPVADHAAAAARDVAVNRFLASLGIGRAVVRLPDELPGTDEDVLAREWRRTGVPAEFARLRVAGHMNDVQLVPWTGWGDPREWKDLFAAGLSDATRCPGGRA